MLYMFFLIIPCVYIAWLLFFKDYFKCRCTVTSLMNYKSTYLNSNCGMCNSLEALRALWWNAFREWPIFEWSSLSFLCNLVPSLSMFQIESDSSDDRLSINGRPPYLVRFFRVEFFYRRQHLRKWILVSLLLRNLSEPHNFDLRPQLLPPLSGSVVGIRAQERVSRVPAEVGRLS